MLNTMKLNKVLSRSLLAAPAGFALAALVAAIAADSWPTAMLAALTVVAAGAAAWMNWRAAAAADDSRIADVLGVLDRALDRDVEGIEAEIHRVQNLIGEAVAEDLIDQIFSQFCLGK